MAKLHNTLEVAWPEIAGVGEANERHEEAFREKRPAVGALLLFDHKPRVQPGARASVDEAAVGRGRNHTVELDERQSRC